MGNADLGEREEEILEHRGRTETSPRGREGNLCGELRAGGAGVKRAQERSLGAGGKWESGTPPHPEGISEWSGAGRDQCFPWYPIFGECAALCKPSISFAFPSPGTAKGI